MGSGVIKHCRYNINCPVFNCHRPRFSFMFFLRLNLFLKHVIFKLEMKTHELVSVFLDM